MVTDQQVRKLMKLNRKEKDIAIAASKSGMCENTARKYMESGKLPSQYEDIREYRTRDNPFDDIWEDLKEKLEINSGLEAKTLFDWLQRENPGQYQDGQLRTLQRRIKQWRGLEGPAKEVYFCQEHRPGDLSESDFTNMNKLGVTIGKEPFDHLIYHFVLTYSNWETGMICFSESFESLSAGVQNALWELGGVPAAHRTDCLSAAVINDDKEEKEEFTRRYQALLRHYHLKGQKIQAGKANENGDIEQRHHRFKKALDQSLLLRGQRDFDTREAYESFLRKLFEQLNSGRWVRLEEELQVLQTLPAKRLDDFTVYHVKVSSGSTIRIKNCVYSVHSRMIDESIEVRLYADYLDIWYAQRRVERIPRLRGKGKHHIQYRHIIDWLIRKPGAFENYRYREDLFPTSRFRMAYDQLKLTHESSANKEYLKILHLAAKETESGVDDALRWQIDHDQPISYESVLDVMTSSIKIPKPTEICVQDVNLEMYDGLLVAMEVR